LFAAKEATAKEAEETEEAEAEERRRRGNHKRRPITPQLQRTTHLLHLTEHRAQLNVVSTGLLVVSERHQHLQTGFVAAAHLEVGTGRL
jgi:hypothetical protein